MKDNIRDFIDFKTIFYNEGTLTYSDDIMLNLPKENTNITKFVSSNILEAFYEGMLYRDRFTTFDFITNFLEINNYFSSSFSQGVIFPPTWKGLEILKSTEDISLYIMLLQEIPFKSLVELGTGNGNSLKFFQDISENNLEILSFDINGVYNYCDLNNLNTLDSYIPQLQSLKTPTLFIEDSHTNVFNTLEYFWKFSTPGCYFFIEDSADPEKFKEVEKFCRKHSSQLYIDKKYTGKFGTFNSIILKHIK